ncbi:UNVERIFIED_ORG: DUF1062 domain-containing protein (plasmid) [Roseateles sp. XES5]|nr:DUF1062 domain-containing protein [Roseateles sp. XES5]
MQNTLVVRWTIVPTAAPQPIIACSTCGGPRPFRSSDRLRLNANGKKLDAWLIYKCTVCDRTWNRSLFERRNIREIDPATLQALQSNDVQWARRHAFDIEALRRKVPRIEIFPESRVRKTVLSQASVWNRIEIVLSVPVQGSLRLDRLLAAELDLSRSRLQALQETGRLKAAPFHKDALRRPARDGSRIVIDVGDLPERTALSGAARGEDG